MVKILGQTTPKYGTEVGSKLPKMCLISHIVKTTM